MANKIDILVASTPIKNPAEKFYNFFKFHMNDLVKIFPTAFTEAKVVKGEDGTAGCIKQWSYVVGGIQLTAKVLTEAIDDTAKSIKYTVLEGDLLKLYKSFKVTLTVSDGSAACTIAFEKATLITPPPELYVPFFVAMFAVVDAYLLVN